MDSPPAKRQRLAPSEIEWDDMVDNLGLDLAKIVGYQFLELHPCHPVTSGQLISARKNLDFQFTRICRVRVIFTCRQIVWNQQIEHKERRLPDYRGSIRAIRLWTIFAFVELNENGGTPSNWNWKPGHRITTEDLLTQRSKLKKVFTRVGVMKSQKVDHEPLIPGEKYYYLVWATILKCFNFYPSNPAIGCLTRKTASLREYWWLDEYGYRAVWNWEPIEWDIMVDKLGPDLARMVAYQLLPLKPCHPFTPKELLAAKKKLTFQYTRVCRIRLNIPHVDHFGRVFRQIIWQQEVEKPKVHINYDFYCTQANKAWFTKSFPEVDENGIYLFNWTWKPSPTLTNSPTQPVLHLE